MPVSNTKGWISALNAAGIKPPVCILLLRTLLESEKSPYFTNPPIRLKTSSTMHHLTMPGLQPTTPRPRPCILGSSLTQGNLYSWLIVCSLKDNGVSKVQYILQYTPLPLAHLLD